MRENGRVVDKTAHDVLWKSFLVKISADKVERPCTVDQVILQFKTLIYIYIYIRYIIRQNGVKNEKNKKIIHIKRFLNFVLASI